MVELSKVQSLLLGRVRKPTLRRLKLNSLLTANVMERLPKVNIWEALDLPHPLTLPTTNIERKDKLIISRNLWR